MIVRTASASLLRALMPTCAQSRRSYKSRNVTFAMSPTECSTSRGIAMSTMSKGELGDSPRTERTNSAVMIGSVAPVHVSTTSATPSALANSEIGLTTAPTVAASCSARSVLRFITVTDAEPALDNARAMPAPMSPAPTTRTLRPCIVPNNSFAISTAA